MSETTLTRGRPLRVDRAWVRSVAREHSIVDPQTETVHLLNETALAIWRLCDGQTLPSEMVEVICDVSGLVKEIVEEDVGRVLKTLEDAELITWQR